MSAPAGPLPGPSGPSGPLPSAPPAAGPVWHRLHPVTPVLRSWRVLAVILAVGVHQGAPELLSASTRAAVGGGAVLIGLGGVVGAVLLSIGLSALTWRVTVYAVDAEAVRHHSGLIFRRQRAARLDRLQAVDVAQPALARVFGFAEVKIEVAGGSGSDIRLSYLREADAQRLRNTLLARSAGLAYEGEEAPRASEATVVDVPLPRVLGALALSPVTGWVVAVLAALVVTAVLTHDPGPLIGVAPAAVATVGGLVTAFTGMAAWNVSVAGDGLRVRHGLLGTRSQTVLPGRVQAVRLSQPLLWRPAGWWRVHANVAGYGRDGRNDRRTGDQHLLLPVGTRAEAETVLGLLLPALVEQLRADGGGGRSGGPAGASAGAPAGGLAGGLVGTGTEGGWTASPRRARLLDPLSWRRHGVLVTGEALLLRRGRLHRQLDVVPHERTQSIALHQGPLQRRMRLAGFALHSTRGPVRPRVEHLDAADAAALLASQAERARAARAGAGPERWMEALSAPAGPGPLEQG